MPNFASAFNLAADAEHGDIVEKCLDDTGGDLKSAATLLVGRLNADEALFRQVMTPFVCEIARREIRRLAKSRRRGDPDTPREKVQPVTALPAGILAVAQRNWLEYPLFSTGLTLGDAGAEQLLCAAETHIRESRRYAARGRLFKSIAGKLPAGKRVREALTHEDIQRLSIQTA